MKYDVPFVPNEPDNLHCYQAATLSILQYFEPDTSMDMATWTGLTGFEKDKGTWASAGLLWFNAHGYTVKHLSLFDYEDFADNGADYLQRLTNPEVAAWQVAHTNMPLEQTRARALVEQGIHVKREPMLQDIRDYLDRGYLLRPLINARKLKNQSGYTGHSVAIIGYDNEGIIIHNPGLPPRENQHIPNAVFEAAWADPNVESKEVDVIKKPNIDL